MTTNLLILKYNNYFNRVVKKEDNVDSYILGRDYTIIGNVNTWNPNDGINTTQIVNWNEDWNPDYLVTFNEFSNITGRWFITESVRTRAGQYRLTLKRDTVADSYELIIKAPCFIEKATLQYNDPLIFNDEPFKPNQIKMAETPLAPEWPAGWYAIFYDKSLDSSSEASNPLTGTFATANPSEIDYVEVEMTEEELPNSITICNEAQYGITYKREVSEYHTNTCYIFINKDGEIANFRESSSGSTSLSIDWHLTKEAQKNLVKDTLSVDSTLNTLLDSYTEDPNGFDLEFIHDYEGRIIKTSDNKFFKVVVSAPTPESESTTQPAAGTSLFSAVSSRFAPGGILVTGFLGSFSYGTLNIYAKKQSYSITYLPLTQYSGTYDLRASGKNTTDAAYGVVMLPYAETSVPGDLAYYKLAPVKTYVNKSIISEVLRKSATGTSSIYDVQILPYCPYFCYTSIVGTVGHNLVATLWDAKMYKEISDSNSNVVTLAVYPSSVKFTKNLYFDIAKQNDAIERKVANQVDIYRLCSPNFNGQFEFSAEKNGGVDYFNVDVTLKPYQSYIHINPNFKNLYGGDYNDPRGLICGGDFSMSRTTDAWESYKLQNKNYEAMFDRTIQNMDYNHKWDMVSGGLSAITGSFQGAAAGGLLAGKSGAIGGGLASFAGGIADQFINEAKFKEGKDFQTDMHVYQLDNIKALPTSMSKVDAFNNNFKVWPVLEKYSCTDMEKEVFRKMIQYEGMTVNAIGTISDYLQPTPSFIKGQIIRLDGIGESPQYAHDVYNEIAKGVYI